MDKQMGKCNLNKSSCNGICCSENLNALQLPSRAKNPVYQPTYIYIPITIQFRR